MSRNWYLKLPLLVKHVYIKQTKSQIHKANNHEPSGAEIRNHAAPKSETTQRFNSKTKVTLATLHVT